MIEKYIEEVAQVERAGKGKIYPAGCTLIALSATKGNVEYLHKAGEVETRYAVIIPNTEMVQERYLYISICQYFPEFLHKHRTGINLQFTELQYLKIGVCDLTKQQEIVRTIESLDERIQQEEQYVNRGKEFKKYMLEKMMAR